MAKNAVDFQIDGVLELKAKLNGVLHTAETEIKQAIDIGTGLIENRAKHLVPVDTGNLMSHIAMQPAKSDNDTISGLVIAATDYAIYVECGTGSAGQGTYPYETPAPLTYKASWPGQVAKPYLVPALYRSQTQIRRLVAKAVQAAITKG